MRAKQILDSDQSIIYSEHLELQKKLGRTLSVSRNLSVESIVMAIDKFVARESPRHSRDINKRAKENGLIC